MTTPGRFPQRWFGALAVVLVLLAVAGGRLALARPAVDDATCPLAGDPSAVAADSQTRHTFVTILTTGGLPGAVAMLDTWSGRLLRTVPVGYNPSALAIAARTARVFVLTGNATVVMLDTTTGTLLRTLTLGALPYAVAIDERAARVFVDTADGRLDMLDAATGALLHGAALGGHPGAIAVDADRSRVVVSTVTATQERVAVFDARADRLLRTIAIDTAPGKAGGAVTIDRASGDAFVAQSTSGRVSMVDVGRGAVLRTAFVTTGVTAIAALARTKRVAVTGEGRAMVTVLDAKTGHVLHMDTAGSLPVGLAVDPHAGRLFVVRQGTVDTSGMPRGPGRVDVLDARSGALLRTVLVGGVPVAIATDPLAGRLIVAYRGGVAASDATAWVPDWLRRWLAFLPPASHTIQPGVRLLRAES